MLFGHQLFLLLLVVSDEEGCGVRLLEPVPVQPRSEGRGQEPLHPGLQGARGRLSGVPDERGPLRFADAFLPRARRGALQGERAGRHGPLRSPAEAQDGVQRGLSLPPQDLRADLRGRPRT